MTKRNSQLPEIWRRYKKNKVAMVGLVILIFIILIAVFADVIVPYEKCIEQVGSERLQGPAQLTGLVQMTLAEICSQE